MTSPASRRPNMGRKLLIALVSVAMIFGASAAPVLAKTIRPLIVSTDRGGPIGQRQVEIRSLLAQKQRVELRGTCLSSCTMYLGLRDVCVAREAVFGFHGPSMNGKPLPPAGFDYWSNVMAKTYRPALRRWFMETGRHEIKGYYHLTGSELIRMGYKPC